MLGRDHALSGALAFTAAAPIITRLGETGHLTGPVTAHLGPMALVTGAAVTAGAGVLPDLDHPDSTIALTFGFVTNSLAWVVEHVSGGHRHGTHSLIGVAVFAAATTAAVHYDHSRGGLVALGLLLGLLLSAALRALRIGSHHGDLLGIAAAAALIWRPSLLSPAGLAILPWCIGLGALAHIAGDMLTHGGCPLAWPFSRRYLHLLPKPMRITTGKAAEHRIVSPLLMAGIGLLLARETGLLR